MAEAHVTANFRLVLLGVTAVLQAGLSVPPLLVHDHGAGPWVAFAVLALVTLVCAGWVARRRPLPAAVVAGGVAAVLAASAAATAALPPDSHFGAPHWSFGLAGWHLLLLLVDRAPALVAALSAHVALTVGRWVLAGVPDRAEVGEAGVVLLSATSFQLGVLVIFRMLVRSARQAAEVTAARERAATRAAVAEQWERDLRAGFAGQLGTTLPLLADLADRVLDPRDDRTRLRCSLAATQLRRLFAENDDVPDPLVHEVTACVHVAERRGVAVSFAVGGAPVPVPTEVRRALTGPVAAALAAARDRARVSLLRGADGVRVAVLTDTGDTAPGPGTTSDLVEVELGTYGRQTRMEARWRTS